MAVPALAVGGLALAGTVAATAATGALLAALVAAALALLDSWAQTRASEVLTGPGAATQRRLAACSELLKAYRPFPGLRNRHLTTILPSLLRLYGRPLGVDYRRECVRMKDGGFVTLDWLCSQDSAPANAPLLLLLSGIAGGSGDAYVQHMVADARDAGFRPVCFNSRGCAGGPLTVPQFYSASFTSDLREVVALLATRHAAVPRFALGWSLGANILVNYLGEEGLKNPSKQLLDGAVSMGNPFELTACDTALESGLGPLYSRSMGKGLRRVFEPHAALFQGLPQYDVAAVRAAATVRDFDEAVTRRTFGFETVDDYYRASGSAARLRHVALPLLCVQAADDPIAIDAAIPRAEVARNPHVALVVTPSGGHLGWVEAGGSPFGRPTTYPGVIQWLTALVAERRRAAVSELDERIRATGGVAALVTDD